jgi:hypothetical protein
MQLAARVADQLYEPRLDKRMHILHIRLFEIARVPRALFENGLESTLDTLGFRARENARAVQAVAVCQASAHVRFKKPAVKTERAIEPCKPLIGLAREPPAP